MLEQLELSCAVFTVQYDYSDCGLARWSTTCDTYRVYIGNTEFGNHESAVIILNILAI